MVACIPDAIALTGVVGLEQDVSTHTATSRTIQKPTLSGSSTCDFLRFEYESGPASGHPSGKAKSGACIGFYGQIPEAAHLSLVKRWQKAEVL